MLFLKNHLSKKCLINDKGREVHFTIYNIMSILRCSTRSGELQKVQGGCREGGTRGVG